MKDKRISQIIAELLEDKELLKRTSNSLKRIFDGEPKNINPLKELPKPQIEIYCFEGFFNLVYFDTKKELKKYKKNNDTSMGNICTIQYLGNVAGRSDVIKIKYESGKKILCTAIDSDGYAVYNEERSTYKGEFVWEFEYGNLKSKYTALRDRGIVFENDIYVKIEERTKELLKKLREDKKF